jgi:hypothetical protein
MKPNIQRKAPLIIKCFRVAMIVVAFLSIMPIAVGQQHTISSIAPTSAAAGETVTITGTNFSTITGVTFGGTAAASYNVVSATRITAVVAAGTTGSVVVSKSGFSNATIAGFTFSLFPNVTGVITDFGNYWNTNTTTNNSIRPSTSHHLIGFTYGGVNYSTGVNNASLSSNGVSYTAGVFKALPAILNGSTSGASLYIVAPSEKDGNTAIGLYTHPDIKNMTIQNVLSDGLNGLDLGTGYTNLPVGSTSNFTINSISTSKISDSEPDIIVTQIADPSTSAFDTYRFLDAGSNVVGNSITVDLSKIASLGSYYLDLFPVANGTTFNVAKPNAAPAVSGVNTTRNIRLIAFKLSDFGINGTNYSQVKTLQITPSGVSDMAFVAYNANAINVPPSISQNTNASSTVICSSGGGSAYMVINATAAGGGTLSYTWEVSVDGGNNWSAVADGGIYSGATTAALSVSTATVNYQYRCTATEAGSLYSAVSSVFTITAIVNSALSGTLNPVAFSACLNANSGTTSFTVSPAGGTGVYSYQWSAATTAGGTYTAIDGAVYNNYSPSLSVAGTMYYKVLVTSGCVSNLSAAASVTVSGDEISTVTNGAICSTGTVGLSATATGGTINWYNVNTGGTSLGTGTSFTTASISATTTYYVGTTNGACASNRVPVVATVTSGISISATNMVIAAADICPGTGATVSVATSALIDGSYTINYSVSGANTIGATNTSITISDGTGVFNTSTLSNQGSNTITINNIVLTGCTITPSGGNTATFNVTSGSPSVSSFNVSVADGCSNAGSSVTVQSSSLATGNYIITYSISGANTVASATAQLNFTAGAPGSGTFVLPYLTNAGSGNIVNVSAIALLSSPGCSSAVAASSPGFSSNVSPVVDAGTPLTICAGETAANITQNASASGYSALLWSTNGTGSFSNNTTPAALSSTTYSPSAGDIAAGSVLITLNATGNSGCAAISKTFTLTIDGLSVGGNTTGNQSINAGTQPSSITLSGQTGSILKWQRASDAGFTAPSDIAVTSSTLSGATIGVLNNTTYFRAVLKNASCDTAYSSTATVTVLFALPYKLISLNLNTTAGTKKINWRVADAASIIKYEIEQSANGYLFIKIGEVISAERHFYYEYKITAGTSSGMWYRIKAVDKDGQFFYSHAINDKLTNQLPDITVHPSPSTLNENIFITTKNLAPGAYTYVVVAAGGQVVGTQNIEHVNIISTHPLPPYIKSKLMPGVYAIKITNSSGFLKTLRLLVN